MRVPLKDILEKLGVQHVLSPYETHPWMLYDSEKGMTCSAEVRMGANGQDLEAEIQLLSDESDAEDEDGETTASGGPQQIMRMKASPIIDDQWGPIDLIVKGESYKNKFYDWEGKACNFFRACIQSIQMNEMPEFEELIEKELSEDGGFGGGRRGRIGRKSPKIKPANLLGMKK